MFLHALFMVQAMAALASSKEADWNAMRLRLAHNMFTTVSSLQSFPYGLASVGLARFAAQRENKSSRILIELDDQKVAWTIWKKIQLESSVLDSVILA